MFTAYDNKRLGLILYTSYYIHDILTDYTAEQCLSHTHSGVGCSGKVNLSTSAQIEGNYIYFAFILLSHCYVNELENSLS